jgi:hypothetical protein
VWHSIHFPRITPTKFESKNRLLGKSVAKHGFAKRAATRASARNVDRHFGHVPQPTSFSMMEVEHTFRLWRDSFTAARIPTAQKVNLYMKRHGPNAETDQSHRTSTRSR